MKRLVIFSFLFVALCGHAQQPKPENPFQVKIKPDRPDHRYDTGETATFEITVVERLEDERPVAFGSVEFSVTDGLKLIEKDVLGITGNPLTVSFVATRPGFVKCEAQFVGGGEKSGIGRAAVAISPEDITPSRKAPVDFDAFWDEQKAQLKAVPPTVDKTVIETKFDGLETADVQISCSEDESILPVSGYFSRPKDAGAESLPALLWVQGAGVRSAYSGQAEVGANAGFLSMDINAHGIENGKPEAFYNELSKSGFLKNYPTLGRENRDGSYFRGMYLRLVRAIDFLTSQPEWDGKTVAVIGHSQGGGQAIVAAALDKRVTFIAAGVPAMCDHSAALRKRLPGWPRLVPNLPGSTDLDPQIAEVSRYFDVVNFASRYDGEAVFSVGFVDRVCPPSSVYAAYNQLSGDKRIINNPEMGHAAPESIQIEFLESAKNHAKKDKAN